jgi:hypothetical protein
MTHLLHITHQASGAVHTVSCGSKLLRALWIISLAKQPVTVTVEDREVA